MIPLYSKVHIYATSLYKSNFRRGDRSRMDVGLGNKKKTAVEGHLEGEGVEGTGVGGDLECGG